MAFFFVFIVVVAMDQGIKILAMQNLAEAGDGGITFTWFDLHLVYNKGAAFGIMQGHRTIFIVIAVIAFCAAVYYIGKYRPERRLQIIIGLITGGAVGNLIDRILYGHVIDYIDFRWWPVFNLADCAIVCGAGLLALYIWMVGRNGIEEGEHGDN